MSSRVFLVEDAPDVQLIVADLLRVAGMKLSFRATAVKLSVLRRNNNSIS